MSNTEEENYLDNLLKNVMEPHPVQPRERESEVMEEQTAEEPALEAADFSLDDLGEELSEAESAEDEPVLELLSENPESEPELDTLPEAAENEPEPDSLLEEMESQVISEPIPEEAESEPELETLLADMESESMAEPSMEDTESDFNLDALDEEILGDIGLNEPNVKMPDLSGEEDDFDDVLNLLNDDSDLAEINDLLKKSDSKEPVQDDMMELLNQMADDEEKQFAEEEQKQTEENTASPEQSQIIEEEAAAGDVKAGKLKKAKVSKKKKANTDGAQSEKKPGVFAKLFNALTEEFEPEPTEEELAKEAEEKAAAKQEALTKKEEEKRVKAEEKKAKDEEKEAAKKAKAEAAAQKKKEKQAAKEAKLAEKRAKEEAEAPKHQKRISPKKIVLVTVFAASVLASVLLFTNLISREGSLQRARKAYYEGNYQTVYIEMYGSELEESDTLVQARSRIILKMQRKYDSYVNHLKMGQEVKALNALIEGLRTYDSVNAEAKQYGVIAEVDEIKTDIVNILDANYGLDEATARQLLQNEDEITYTKSLSHIIMGNKSDLVSNSDMMQKAE